MAEFGAIFQKFLLGEYHVHLQRDLSNTLQERWEADGFLARMPESLEQFDLFPLTIDNSRRTRRDCIRFQNLCYMAPILAV